MISIEEKWLMFSVEVLCVGVYCLQHKFQQLIDDYLDWDRGRHTTSLPRKWDRHPCNFDWRKGKQETVISAFREVTWQTMKQSPICSRLWWQKPNPIATAVGKHCREEGAVKKKKKIKKILGIEQWCMSWMNIGGVKLKCDARKNWAYFQSQCLLAVAINCNNHYNVLWRTLQILKFEIEESLHDLYEQFNL